MLNVFLLEAGASTSAQLSERKKDGVTNRQIEEWSTSVQINRKEEGIAVRARHYVERHNKVIRIIEVSTINFHSSSNGQEM